MKRSRAAQVCVNGRIAGFLQEHTDGLRFEYQFHYDNAYLIDGSPIGYHFPLQKQPFLSDVLPPFFENLTSEGWVRVHQSGKGRTDKQDSFGLLLANGNDLIGAITIIPVEPS